MPRRVESTRLSTSRPGLPPGRPECPASAASGPVRVGATGLARPRRPAGRGGQHGETASRPAGQRKHCNLQGAVLVSWAVHGPRRRQPPPSESRPPAARPRRVAAARAVRIPWRMARIKGRTVVDACPMTRWGPVGLVQGPAGRRRGSRAAQAGLPGAGGIARGQGVGRFSWTGQWRGGTAGGLGPGLGRAGAGTDGQPGRVLAELERDSEQGHRPGRGGGEGTGRGYCPSPSRGPLHPSEQASESPSRQRLGPSR
jgi:hypothetical protein